MVNFLNIQWQENILQQEGSIILRAARGSGKSYISVRWAIEQIKKNKDVHWVSSVFSGQHHIIDLFIVELERQSIGYSISTDRSYITTGLGDVYITNPRSASDVRLSLVSQALVIDDADYLRQSDFHTIMRRTASRTPILATGRRDANAFNEFLYNGILDDASYHEVSYIDCISSGLIPSLNIGRLKREYPTEIEFKRDYGPWEKGQRNADYVYLLQRFDD